MNAHTGTLIIGATRPGLQAALTLARCNHRVTLIDRDCGIDGAPKHWSDGGKRWQRQLLKEIAYHPLIQICTETEVAAMKEEGDGIEVEWIQRPQWVLPSLCVDCRKCVLACPVELADGRKPIFALTDPTTVVIDKRETAPCRSACPLDMNVQGYVALIARGMFDEAYELILDKNPLPGICGRVCHHPCENVCRRREIDEPIAVCSLKRFATDQARKKRIDRDKAPVAPPDGPRVAIIGSGPAGLTAAHDLAKAGFRPTLIEAEGEPGGLLRQGIAPYRLPREILQEEIERILALGADLRLNAPVESWEDLESLKAAGYDAILLATGAAKDRKLGIPGEDLEGIYGCVTFLMGLWHGHRPASLGRVVVIGGGNAAVEAARTCVRAGARSVALLYRRTRKEMPADPHEVEQALEEGMELSCLTLPTGFEGRGNRLYRIRCVKMKLEGVDASGRPRPVPIDGSDFSIQVDTAIVSIGQGADPSYGIGRDLELTPWGTIKTSVGGQTSIPGIYASGDVVFGPSTVVEAMASGRRAAQTIIQSQSAAEASISCESETDWGEYEPIPKGTPRQERRPLPHRKVQERIKDYEEVIGPFSRSEALKEASRCLQCGVCSECLQCAAACDLGAIHHNRTATSRSARFDRVIVADHGQLASNLESSRLIRVPFVKTNSLAKAMLAGRMAALDAIPRAPLVEWHRISTKALDAGDLRAGVFICSCNGTLNENDRLDEMLASLEGVPGVAHAEVLIAACHPEKGRRIEEVMIEKELNGAVIASCACCHLDFVCESCTDQRIRLKHRLFRETGYEPKDIALVNIKDTCLLPFKDDPKVEANLSLRVLRSGLWQLRDHKKWSCRVKEPHEQALVLGATEAGLAAARGLADRIPSVVVVDEQEVEQVIQETFQRDGIDLICPVKPVRLDGQRGAFTLFVEDLEASATTEEAANRKGLAGGQSKSLHEMSSGAFSGDPTYRSISAGVVILGRDDFKKLAYKRDPFVRSARIGTKRALGTLETDIPGVYLASWAQARKVPQEFFGKAAASEALEEIWGSKDPSDDFVACVDPELCRGCGSCTDICPEGAARLEEIARGVASAWIEPRLCTGCGNCLAECPTGAIRMPESEQGYFEKVIDVLLGK